MRRDKMWWHTGRYVVLFLSTVLCSSSVWGMQTLNRAQDCPSILEGIPDQYLITGKLFLYTIPEKALKYGNNGSIRISSASEDQQLPSWISFEETTRKLIAIPTTHDGFGLYIKVTLSDRLNKCEDVSDIFYLEVKPFYMRYEHSDNDKPEKTCYKGINLIQTTLIFAVNLYKLDAMARYSIMKNLADFLDINAMLIAISTSKELFSIQDKSKSYSILASGRGNTDAVLPNVTELTWRVPCSVFKEVSLFMQVLQHNVVGGRLTREVGYDVVGWYISALVNPSKQYRSRKKRLAPRLSTPTPTPQIQVIPATKALKSSSSLYSASLKTQLLKSSKKLEPKVYETKTDDDHMTDRITSTEESRSTFVSSRVSAVEFEPTKSFTAPTPSASLYDTLKSASFQSSGDQLRPTPTSTYSEYVPKETGRPVRHTTTLQWRESSKYHTGVYEISGSGDVSRFSEFTTDEPITSTTGFGEDFTKPPLTPFIAATPTLTTAVDAVADGDEDIIKTDLEYNGSGSGSGSGDEDIDEEDVTSQIALKPSESSLLGESTPIVKTLYVDQTDTNTFYFEESEIAIRNIPQTTTYEETATPSLSVVHSASWPSRQFPIDRLTLVDVPYVSTSSSHASVTYTPSQSSSKPVRPSRIISGHSYIDSQIGVHSSATLQPPGSSRSGHSYVDSRVGAHSSATLQPSGSSRSGHSYVDSRVGAHSSATLQPSGSSRSGHSYVDSRVGAHSSIHVEQSERRSGHSYIDIKPSHSSGQSYIDIKPSHSSGQSYIDIKPSHRSGHSYIDIKPSHSSGQSYIVHKPSQRANETTSIGVKPSHISNHSSIYRKSFPKIDGSSSTVFKPSQSVAQSSANLIVPGSSDIHSYISQSHHRIDQSSRIPSSNFRFKSSHSKPHPSSIGYKPSESGQYTSRPLKPSHIIYEHSSIKLKPSHTADHMLKHLKTSYDNIHDSSIIQPSIKPSPRSIGQSYHRTDQPVSIKPSHSRTYHSSLLVKPSHGRVDPSSEMKPSHRSVDLLSTGIRQSHKRVDRSSEHIKPSSSHKRVDRSSEHIKPSSSHKRVDRSSEHIKPSSSHIRVDRLSEHIKPSSSHRRVDRLSEHIKPSSSHRRVDRSSEHIKPSSSHRRVDRLSEHIKPSSSNRRVDRPSVEIIPSQISDSFHPKPSHIHIIDLWPSSSHRSDYSTIMPSSSDIRELPSRKVGPFSRSREIYLSESRLPIASRDLSSGLYLASVLLRLSSQRQDMISSSSHILLLSHSKERYRPSSSSMTQHLSKTKDKDSDFESTRLYSTPVVFPTNPDEWTTPGLRRSKDYKDTFIIPELSKYSSTRCTSGHGCKTDQLPESATRRSTWFPNEHSKTVDEYFTTESTDSNKKVTDEGRFVTEQIPKWYSVEFTPELTTVRSRKTQKKQRKESKPPNLAPDIINPIGKIYAFAGKTFEFQIPENTFNDLEDGSTRDLTLDIAFKWDSYKPPTYSQSWVQFDEAKQTFSGLPLPRDVKESPVEITINAIDQGGKIAQDIILIHINSTDGNIIPTQEFIMRFDVNGRRFLNDRRKLKNLIKKLSAYFADKDSSYITVMDARPGSLIVTWTNNSIATDHCDNMTIHEMRQKVVDQRGYINPKFSKYMSPKYKVTSVEFQLKGACQDVSEPSGAGGMVQVDPWAEAIIPTVIAVAIAIFIVVIILLICSRKQNKEKNKQKEPRHSFEDQDPVMFHREQAQKDKVIRSKRAVILPGDGKPKSSGRRKFFPQIGSPYQPSTFEDHECPSDEEIYGNENATYNSNSHSQPPPPYRLPPPYHVDNGSSYV